jgi:hypothetical protein
MHELPGDAERLRVIRLYPQMQLDAVDAKICKAEAVTGAHGRAPGHAATLGPSLGRPRMARVDRQPQMTTGTERPRRRSEA